MAHATARDAEEPDLALSLVRDDALFRLQRAIGLIPKQGLGIGRRALLLSLFTWLPIAAWAALVGRALPGTVPEPLFEHFGVHVRCLIAIPLLVLAEGSAHRVTTLLFPCFLRFGLVGEEDAPRFRAIMRRVTRLRGATLPWVLIAGLVIAWSALEPVTTDVHEVVWAQEGGEASPRFGFGGVWYLYVVRPIFVALMLAWLWRLALLFVLVARISRLPLVLVPTHPDRVGGLGFLETLPSAFGLVVLAVSAVFASRLAHEVAYHGVELQALKINGVAFLVVMLLLFLGPLLAFAPRLLAAKREALLAYGALVRQHGYLTRKRWILGEPVQDDALISAPEIGPVADTVSLYEAVTRMRLAPIGKRALFAILVPAVVPMLAVVAMKVPLRDVLLGLLKIVA